jgi:hypothetical protein
LFKDIQCDIIAAKAINTERSRQTANSSPTNSNSQGHILEDKATLDVNVLQRNSSDIFSVFAAVNLNAGARNICMWFLVWGRHDRRKVLRTGWREDPGDRRSGAIADGGVIFMGLAAYGCICRGDQWTICWLDGYDIKTLYRGLRWADREADDL